MLAEMPLVESERIGIGVCWVKVPTAVWFDVVMDY